MAKLGASDHDKFIAKHRVHVEQVLSVGDYESNPDHSGGTVYRCQELKCKELPAHSHRRRPFMIWCVG